MPDPVQPRAAAHTKDLADIRPATTVKPSQSSRARQHLAVFGNSAELRRAGTRTLLGLATSAGSVAGQPAMGIRDSLPRDWIRVMTVSHVASNGMSMHRDELSVSLSSNSTCSAERSVTMWVRAT